MSKDEIKGKLNHHCTPTLRVDSHQSGQQRAHMTQHSSLGLSRHSPNLFKALNLTKCEGGAYELASSHKTNLNLGLLRNTSTLLFNSYFNRGS